MRPDCEEKTSNPLPRWRRARGYHLYDTEGRRYVDFWQEGGWALCGYKPKGVAKAMKNTLSRGLWSTAPDHTVRRLEKKLRTLLGSHHLNAVVYSQVELHEYIRNREAQRSKQAAKELYAWWRPFLGASAERPYLVPILPFPWLPRPYLLCGPEAADELPELSSVVAAGLIRAIDLVLLRESADIPVIDVGKIWRQEHCYLFYRGNTYRADHAAFLDMGIVLPPRSDEAAIIPALLEEHERALWARALASLDAGRGARPFSEK